MVTPFRRSRAFACSATISLAALLTAPVAGAQDSERQSAATYVAEVAQAQSDVDALRLDIGELQESVNRSFVELRDAQARAEQARRGAHTAAERLAAAQADVDKARAELDQITRSQYRGTATPAVVGTLAGESGHREALERSSFLRQRTLEKREALAALERARTEAANDESVAREAAELAEAAAADAERAEAATRTLFDETSAALEARTAELEAAEATLEEATAQLDAVRGDAATQDAATQNEAPEAESADAEHSPAPAANIAPEVIEQVQERVAEIAPEAEASNEEALSQAVLAAQTVQATESADEATVDQAAEIAAAAALVDESQAPHATFADPYAGAVNGSSISNLSSSRSLPDAGAVSEIVSAFAGGLQTGVAVGQGNASVSDGVSALLPTVQTPETVTESVQKVVQVANTSAVETAIARAQSMVGTPYVWGGGDANGPTSGLNGGSVKGFDCSGLVLYAFAGAGISLPHYTGDQYKRGTPIDPSQAQRGDLLFWGPGGSQHVAIYLGDGMMIEAPRAGQNVSVVPVRWAGMSPNAVRLL